MPLFLRVISSLNSWDTEKDPPQLSIDDVSADMVTDLRTTNNNLSVFQIENEGTNVDRIITALAATRQHLQPSFFLVFDSTLLDRLKIEVEKTRGGTPDDFVNDFHRNLKVLSGMKLIELAKELLINSEQCSRDHAEVAQYLLDAEAAGRFKLQDSLKLEVIKALNRIKK
jgi:hypothetical protein